MATFLHSPMSPGSGTSFSFIEGTSVCDFVHLSDALEVEENKSSKQQNHESQATYTPQMRTFYQPTRLQSPSEPPTARTQLQQSNVRLLELLESVQEELDKQRNLMRDIQNRVSTLEQESDSNTIARSQSIATPAKTTSHARSKSPSKHTSLLPLESRAWWEACQNFAHNCDTPFNATDFLATPRRFSGLQFDFNFDNDAAQTAVAPPASPVPELHEVPVLTPESEEDTDTHRVVALPPPGDAIITRPRAVTFPSIQPTEAGSDILERVVEFSHIKIPRPPILQSPPRSLKSKVSTTALEDCGEEITALPVMPPREPTPVENVKSRGGHRKIKSLFMVKTLLKGRVSGEKEEEWGSRKLYIHR
ncbi:hypothetical protein T440DRAFT_314958 [Plenodomus tracheiphilus IPT5]|uniref:Uncharacterized protein n=1 Tax=Plenodomus tracheiphilus IPT5 TaxID=1408161 RepID=A0A6A7ARB0_9PLEO|nr:hypothetical protein T440DRAFT_314958 [Plenodomus tracheiphilus IPT5]